MRTRTAQPFQCVGLIAQGKKEKTISNPDTNRTKTVIIYPVAVLPLVRHCTTPNQRSRRTPFELDSHRGAECSEHSSVKVYCLVHSTAEATGRDGGQPQLTLPGSVHTPINTPNNRTTSYLHAVIPNSQTTLY